MSDSSSDQAFAQKTWSLEQWLNHLNSIHPKNIELGLERVSVVFDKLDLDLTGKKVITIAGTNGKGTTAAFIEQALIASGCTVAVFSSPHLLDYRERVRVQNAMLNEEKHCQAFLQVDIARGEIPLTYFEFGTLAALKLMFEAKVDYILLEVGLGGRLDAVNIVDPDIAVITSIDLDHQEWLGDTRDKIAIEKAGIFRPQIPAIIGDNEPPDSLIRTTEEYAVEAIWQGDDFHYFIDVEGFHWKSKTSAYQGLPLPRIPAQNASTAMQVLETLGITLSKEQMSKVVDSSSLPGRRQIIQNHPTVMLDVAHNPQATKFLAEDIGSRHYTNVIAVVAMLSDKDIEKTLEPMFSKVDTWLCAGLDIPRGAKAEELYAVLSEQKKVLNFSSVKQAYNAALGLAEKGDLIIVFGSFFTVAEVLNVNLVKTK